MTRRVLDVGQCNPDHSTITQFLTANFDVEVVQAHLFDDAMEQLRSGRFDLVLVNRLLDQDHSEGSEVIKAMQADAGLKTTPVMLVSNFADAQTAAVTLGAVPGFGKASLVGGQHDAAGVLEKLTAVLGQTTTDDVL